MPYRQESIFGTQRPSLSMECRPYVSLMDPMASEAQGSSTVSRQPVSRAEQA